MSGTVAPRRLGVLVNPIAGMGGRVALNGTDGPDAVRIARERGATPVAPERARRALARIAATDVSVQVLAGPGSLGADAARAAGLACQPTTDTAPVGDTHAADTRNAVAAMRERGIDLLLFAGGDGTARDILDTVGDALPLVGVPTGVKMHSGVFAASPDAAGAVAAAYLREPSPDALCAAEIADAEERAARAARVATRLYGAVRVPRAPALMVGSKAPSAPGNAALDALGAEIARALPGERLTLFGPGTTTAAILDHLRLQGSLLGVDAVRDGRLVGSDLDEAALLRLLDGPQGRDAVLFVGVVGGQGALFGRGNQQLSPDVLRRIGRERIEVVAAAEKLLRLDPPWLRVDTGDDELDATLSGYVRVRVAPKRTIVMKIST